MAQEELIADIADKLPLFPVDLINGVCPFLDQVLPRTGVRETLASSSKYKMALCLRAFLFILGSSFLIHSS